MEYNFENMLKCMDATARACREASRIIDGPLAHKIKYLDLQKMLSIGRRQAMLHYYDFQDVEKICATVPRCPKCGAIGSDMTPCCQESED